MKYKVGDRVKIVKNVSNHEFKITQEARVAVVYDGDSYKVEDHEDWWALEASEMELIKES